MARNACALPRPSCTVWGLAPGGGYPWVGTQVAAPRGPPASLRNPPVVPGPGGREANWDPASMELGRDCFVGWAGSLAAGWHWVGRVPPWQQGGGGVKPGAGSAAPWHRDGVGNGTSGGGSEGWERQGRAALSLARIIAVNEQAHANVWGQGRVGGCVRGRCVGISRHPGRVPGSRVKASSRGTPQQRCCFAYANELMASLGLAVTQQLRCGSPRPRGAFPTAAGWVTTRLCTRLCMRVCTPSCVHPGPS